MRYEYKNISIELENEEVYWLWDLLMFALDYDAENNKQKLTDEKRAFAHRLTNIIDEAK